MIRRRLAYATLVVGFTLAAQPTPGDAQVCQLPESIRAAIPGEPPQTIAYETLGGSGRRFKDVPLGVGHVHRSADNPVLDLPPGSDDWLRRVELPLSRTPGSEPWAWIANGWILERGEIPEALSTHSMVETGYEEPSFVVMERRSDGWMRILYREGEGSSGSAWTPTCALGAGPVHLDFTPWSDWFLSGQISPMFLRTDLRYELHAEPSATSAQTASVSADDILDPLEIRGEWMKVVMKQPSDYCRPDVVAMRHEGWVRWYSQDLGPRVWYFTRGC